MVNITNYIKGLKLTWLRRYINYNGNWGIFADIYLPTNLLSTGGNFTKDYKKFKNPFSSDVLEAWTLFNSNINPILIDDILSEPLWFNSHINTHYISQ
jgi:hypothetical protein